MLDTLITSKTRIKLLMKFFLNPHSRSYLRELATEFGESTNGVRIELNRLEKAGLLSSRISGRTKEYSANIRHSLFMEIHSLVEKYMGIDQIIEKIVKKLGDIKVAYLIGDYAKGIDSGLVDIVLVGKIDRFSLDRMIRNREREINRKIRPLVLNELEIKILWSQLDMDNALPLWGNPINNN